VENLGEGIFLGFDRDAMRQWLKSDGARQHLSKHRDAFKTWNKEHGLTETKFEWPGGAYLMLHSLAHLLITEASLDCGYGASAIKERIYAFDDNDPFCASHEPNSELEKRYAHGAACHGCLRSVMSRQWWPIRSCSSPAPT
jgi:hypothetical protein